MDYKRAKEALKPRLKEYVESITERSKGGSYVCPLCGSGMGSNHTGAFSIDPKEPTRWKCFSCGESGDIFDLIGKVENITDPLAQLRRAGELYRIEIDGTAQADFRENQNQPKTKREEDIYTYTYTHTYTQKEEDYSAYYNECHARLQETDYLKKRGISSDTATRFNLGYDPRYTKDTGGRVWQALIIPTGKGSYIARNTDPEAGEKDRYRKTGSATPLNWEALKKATQPIFIVEGEVDALSIIEAGGEAIGLGSTANINLFIEEYVKKSAYIDPAQAVQPLVLALDNDKAGEKATEDLYQKLRALGITAYRADIYGGHKDANEVLVADRRALSEEIVQAVAFVGRSEEEKREAYYQNSTANHLQDFINGISESANTPAIPTGLTDLDAVLDGGLYEGLYILGAITSLGKTTLALQIADQIADSGRDVVIFSLEMARSELISKSISRLTLLDVLENGGDIRNAKTNRGISNGARWASYSEEEKELIYRSMERYSQYARHIFIHEGIGDIGVEQIRDTVARHRRITGKAPVVLVDYIQILRQPESKHSLTDKQVVDINVTELKRISRDYKIPVIAISSFNRGSYSAEVAYEAFKESGSIEYSSDVLIGLQLKGAGTKDFDSGEAKRKNPREVELVILKNRNGRTGDKLEYNYYPLFNYFEEI